MQLNDLLHIHTQPENLSNPVQGFVGFAEELKDDFVLFQQLTEEGLGGSGWVPINCVSIVNSNPYILHLKKSHDERLNNLCREMENFAVKVAQIKEKYIQQVMNNFPNIDKKDIEIIFGLAEQYLTEVNRIRG